MTRPPPLTWDNQPNYMQMYGDRLVANGYAVVPIMPGTKKPGRWSKTGGWGDTRDWQHFAHQRPTPYHVGIWKNWPGCGVGIVCGDICAVDIDILDAGVAIAVREVFERELGPTPAVRIGLHPKQLLVYRAAAPFRKITAKPLEILCEGQQFVAYATHPDTGAPYHWPEEPLADLDISQLPVVTEEEMRAAVEAAIAVIPPDMRRGTLRAVDNGGPRVSGDLVGTLEAVESALPYIPNADLHWDDWNRIGMAVWAATQGEGFDIFDHWSSTSWKYDAKETEQRWNHYFRSPPSDIGAGTIYELAQQHGWSPPVEIALNPAKAHKVDFSALLAKGNVRPEPDPEPVEEGMLPQADVESFPSEWFHTSSLVGDIVRWINRSALHPMPTFALANTLCALGTLYGRRYTTERTDTRANLFMVGIASPGAGKDHSRKQIKSLLTHAGLSNTIAGDSFTSGQAIINMLGEYPSRISHMDEMGLFLQSLAAKNANPHQRTIIKTLLEIYSSASGVYNGQEYANRKENKRIDIFAPNFNLYGTTTPATLIPALSFSMAENGTLSRMLLVPPFEEYPDYQQPQDHQPPASLVEKIKASWDIKPSGGNLQGEQHLSNSAVKLMPVTWGDEVQEYFVATKNLERERARQRRYIWVRAAELTIKIAMIEAIARDPVRPTVTTEIFDMAWRLVDWCLVYAENILREEVAENETEQKHKQLLKKIRDAGEMTSTQLSRVSQNLSAKERKEIIDTLADAGQIIVERRKSESGRGRERIILRAA